MKDKLIFTITNNHIKYTVIGNYQETFSSKLYSVNESNFLVDELDKLDKKNLDNKIIVFIEIDGMDIHQMNLPKMNKTSVKKIVSKEIENIYGDLKDYFVDINIKLNDKKYFNIIVSLIEKKKINKIKEILKQIKLKLEKVIIASDLYQYLFNDNNSYVVFRKGKIHNSLVMKHKGLVKNILLNTKMTDSDLYRSQDILFGYFKVNSLEINNVNYLAIYENDLSFKDRFEFFKDNWKYMTTTEVMYKLKDYSNISKGIKL